MHAMTNSCARFAPKKSFTFARFDGDSDHLFRKAKFSLFSCEKFLIASDFSLPFPARLDK
jgi:hypothetical protein